MKKELLIHSNIHDYKVFFEHNFDFIDSFYNIEHKVFVIDKNIHSLYPDLFSSFKQEDIFLFEALEENKTLRSVEEIYQFIATKNAKRNVTLISFGGGITQDVTGFVASTLYRGIQWIFIPTTFLAQADSCIGSKTSLNFKSYKNILGGFYPPHKIYIQPDFLNTLARKDYFSGIGEVIKFQLLKEHYPKDFQSIISMIESLQSNKDQLKAIHKTMEVKKAYIDEDEFDTGKRNLFNYGHCFGHALENASHYEVPHGIAVTIGMIYANIISCKRGLLSQNTFDFLNTNLLLPNIFMGLDMKFFDEMSLLNSMQNDKKRVGNSLTIVIPVDDEIRAKKVDDLSEEEFKTALLTLLDILGLFK